jgi:hypothetical protein
MEMLREMNIKKCTLCCDSSLAKRSIPADPHCFWNWIRICIRVKSWIRIRIRGKIQELQGSK